jgi:predicted small secreted protein
MTLKTFLLDNGKSIAVKAVDKHIVIYYDDEKEKIVKNIKEVKEWVKQHYNTELVGC